MIDESIKIISLNANRSSPPTENALNIALERGTDIVLIQEPWFFKNTSENWALEQSTAHSAFTQILPHTPNNRKPRTLAYVSRNFTPSVHLSPSSPRDSDILVLEVSHNNKTLQIINIYNQKLSDEDPTRTFQRSLQNYRLHNSTILMGDFNSHHPWWNPRIDRTSADAEAIAEWFEDKELQLLNKPGQETFFRGHTVIDLALISEAVSIRPLNFVRNDALVSDHCGHILEIPHKDENLEPNPLSQGRYNTKKADWDLFHQSIIQKINPSGIKQLIASATLIKEETLPLDQMRGHGGELKEELDALANKLTEIITHAADKAIPRTSNTTRAKAWWNDELSELRRAMSSKRNQIKKDDEASIHRFMQARNKYFYAIKDAKTEHWNSFLTNEDPKTIFRALKYTNGSKVQRMPQIKNSEGIPQTSFEDKCQAFRSALFPKPPESEEPSWEDYETDSKWEWPTLSVAEIEHACSNKIQSKAPGPDGITQDIITHAYAAIPEIFLKSYRLFIDSGYHPMCWRQATGAVLAKDGKLDYTVPKAYRIITLLNSLGKVSERILAQRLNYLAETTNLLDPSQIGGRLMKSAIDAALLLRNEVETNKAWKLKVTSLFVDVKGAYDHVARQRLFKILLDLRLPPALISWIASFLDHRMLRVAFDNQIQDFSRVQSGVPQGSPISPILFLIYIRDLFKSKNVKWISYVDDICLTTASKSIARNIRLLEREAEALVQLAKTSNIAFDLDKTELLHWEQTKASKKAPLTLPNGDIVQPKPLVKWLGIYFDANCNFKHHVKVKVAKAKNTFQRVARLASLERGLSPHALRQLYIACVTSIADYGAIVWWNNQASFVTQLQRLQNLALRKILGVFKSAPICPMEVEAALPPPEIRIKTSIRGYALRMLKLSKTHPINTAINRTLENNDYDEEPELYMPHLVKIQRSIQNAIEEAEIEEIKHFHFAPWNKSTPYDVKISPLSKEDEAANHMKHLNTSPNNHLHIYTDASATTTKESQGIGIGLAVLNPPAQHTHKIIKKNIGKGNLVYDGELEGATMGAEYAAKIAKPGLHFHVFSDNQAGLWRLKTPSDNPGQANQIRAIKAGNQIKTKGARLTYHWVPGHTDIPGNEAADQLAKEATLLNSCTDRASYAMIGTKIKQMREQEWRAKLNKLDHDKPPTSRTSYRRLYDWKIRSSLIIPRGTGRCTASAFYQLKLGHGRFKDYLYRRTIIDHDLCSCGEKETPEHLLVRCPLYSSSREIIKSSLDTKRLSIQLLLATTTGAKETISFLRETKIATRGWLLYREEWEEQEREGEDEEADVFQGIQNIFSQAGEEE